MKSIKVYLASTRDTIQIINFIRPIKFPGDVTLKMLIKEYILELGIRVQIQFQLVETGHKQRQPIIIPFYQG